jgi:DNA polymerase I-like protein with 3'-5' exonuclease and polymerase domains
MAFSIVRTPFPVYVHDKEEAEDWLQLFLRTAYTSGVGFDTETTGLDVIHDRIRFFSLANKDARICAPLRLLPVFASLLEDPNIEKRMTNAKYDMHMAWNHGIQIRGHVVDTADMDFVMDENRQLHGLKACAKDHLGLRMTPFKQVFGAIGKVEDEVAAMCEVHDILETQDFEKKDRAAKKWATRMLIRMRLVDMPAPLAQALKKLDLGIKAGCVLPARTLLTIGRAFGVATLTHGSKGYISDFVQFLGGPAIPNYKDRGQWAHILEDKEHLEEAHWLLWDRLLESLDIHDDPVEELRERVSDYASLDAWASYMLVDFYRDELFEEEMVGSKALSGHTETLLEHYEDTWAPFLRVLWNMERRGFPFDAARSKAYSVDMQKHIQTIEKAVVQETGNLHFKVGSTKQLREQFFTLDRNGEWRDPFGDLPKKMTKGGAGGNRMPSTDGDTLEMFAGKGNTLAQLVLSHREFSKLNGTYMEALPRKVDRRGRIHTNLLPWGARTWRLASRDPNLQNIPARNPVWGKKIRQLFRSGRWGDCDPLLCMESLRNVPVPVLPPDFPMRLIVADYKQLEMRIMAHLSQDEGMIKAIQKGLDLHCQTVVLASERGVPGIPPNLSYQDVVDAVDAYKAGTATPSQEIVARKRSELKSTGFGIIYGIGALKLGMQLGLPIVKRVFSNGRSSDWCPEADKLIKNYLNDIYPGVGEFIELTKERCNDDLAVYTIIGHPRRLPDIVSRDKALRAQAERQAPNACVQGSAADITNAAMILCETDPVLRKLGVRLLMQIHDELVFEVPDDDKYAIPAKKRIKEKMEDPFPMLVPIEIDIEEGDNWGDAKG